MVASYAPGTGDLAHKTQACALTGNQTSNTLVLRLALNPLSHTGQGCFFGFVFIFSADGEHYYAVALNTLCYVFTVLYPLNYQILHLLFS